MPRSATETTNFERPYSPGWFDRLTDWVDRMPGPNSLYCLGLLVSQFGYVTALLWFNGKLPVGSIDLRLVFMVVVAPYPPLGAVLPGPRRCCGTGCLSACARRQR
jgi:hypothetical protein